MKWSSLNRFLPRLKTIYSSLGIHTVRQLRSLLHWPIPDGCRQWLSMNPPCFHLSSWNHLHRILLMEFGRQCTPPALPWMNETRTTPQSTLSTTGWDHPVKTKPQNPESCPLRHRSSTFDVGDMRCSPNLPRLKRFGPWIHQSSIWLEKNPRNRR